MTSEDPGGVLEDVLRELPDSGVVTRLLVALNVGVFLVLIANGVHVLTPTTDSLLSWGANFGARTLQGEWWRLFTCMFIHGGIVHLAVNMYTLWTVGGVVERMVGSASHLAVYLISGLFGGVVSLAVHPLAVDAGASGAIFGLIGALIGLLLRRRADFGSMPILRRIWITATVLATVNLLAGLMVEFINVAAHFGGLIAGFGCGLVLSQPLTAAAVQGRRIRTVSVAIAGAAALAALGAILPHEVADAEDQFAIAQMYEQGRLLPRDAAKAAEWYRRAAQQRFAPAQYQLGLAYAAGRGVARDESAAARWLAEAAEGGIADAQFRTGLRLAEGNGVERNDAEAVRWYRRAADQGHAGAQHALGFMYERGRGVPRDHAESARWVRLAADQGFAVAQHDMGVRYANGIGVEQNDAEAVRWYRLAADQNHTASQYALGTMYAGGRGVAKDEAEAVRWFRRAAAHGYPEAQAALGFAYLRGAGTSKNSAEARAWFERASKHGFAPASAILAEMHATGNGGPVNNAEAMRLYRSAASQGFAPAQAALGVMYATGRGGSGRPDYVQAYVWLSVAQIDDRRLTGNRDKLAAILTPQQMQLARARIAECRASKFQRCGDPAPPSSQPADPASPPAEAAGSRGDKSSGNGP